MSGLSVVARGVSVTYRRTPALRSVDAEFGSGVTAVLGPNGAGKSTFLRCLATAQWPDSGTITYDGVPNLGASNVRSIRRRLGYMPQEPAVYENFKVAAFLDHMAMLKEMSRRDVRKEEISRALSSVGLDDRADSRVRSLSGGMRQRLSLAQAILGRPPLLVLDEPAAGLDPEERHRFRSLVLSLDATVVLSTHLTDDVALVCDRVIVLLAGRVTFSGRVEDLVAEAVGNVWVSDAPDPIARSWRTSDGSYRNVGAAPSGVTAVAPTVEDAYLVVQQRAQRDRGHH